MAKRFTDTNKYKKPFIRSLQGAYKLLWDFLYHDCDHAGVWIVDFETAQIFVGKDMKVNYEDALKFFNSGEVRIVVLDGGSRWFIPSFIEFQYGKLSEKNRLHISVISILSKYDLLDESLNLKVNKPLTSPLQGAKDKDKEQCKDKEKDKTARESKPLPECEEFVSYLTPFLADLGDPVPLAGWLAEQFVYYSSNVWPKGQYLEWKAFRHSFPQKYRRRHAEIKAKFPPIPKAASKGIKETPMDKLLRENEEMFADGVHPDKWRAANPGKDYIKCKP